MLKSLFSPHFCFPWGRPWGNHAKCCMDGKRIRCLQIVLHHIPIYLSQFPSYSNRKFKKSPFSRTAAHIFVSPGNAPAIITQYFPWVERQLDAYKVSRRMYPSNYDRLRNIGGIDNIRRAVLAVATFIGGCGMRICVSKLWTVLAAVSASERT